MRESGHRKIEYDILRILSALSVVFMHITVNNLYSLPMTSNTWLAGTVINAVSHFGVPVFVMISGAIFLDPSREPDIKRLWLHNILRMILVLIVWSTFYGVTDYLEYKAEPIYILREIIDGRNHLWFIPMIIGLYMIQPFLLRWIKNAKESEIRYFLILFVSIGVIWETLKAFNISGVIDHLDKFRNIEMVCSYVGYFILGYYVVHVGLTKKARNIAYFCGIAGCVLSAVCLTQLSRVKGIPMTDLVDSFSVFTFTYSLAVFTFFIQLFKSKSITPGHSGLIAELGKDTFGLYLCHIALIERLGFLQNYFDALPAALSLIIYALILFIIGILVSAILRRIPFVGRYIC